MKKKQLEKPFEYLRRKDGTAFAPEVVKNWYEARAYVLEKLKDTAIGPESNEHLHVVVTGDSPLMLSVVRQVALIAHFANFDDTKDGNRTMITIVSSNKQILDELTKEEYLSNLPNHCHLTIHGYKSGNFSNFTDIDIEIVERWAGEENGIIVMTEPEATAFIKSKSPQEIYCIDTRKAVIVDRIYSIGTLIDNLPAEDIHSISRYSLALDAFQYRLLKKDMRPLVDAKSWEHDITKVRNGLSNIFCSDCFDLRIKCFGKEKSEAYSKSEHARWVTEKLIMGFRPINKAERIQDERSTGIAKAQYRKQLKENPSDPTHIDICDYTTLRRIDPESLKYDAFLMLAIPMIQDSVQ